MSAAGPVIFEPLQPANNMPAGTPIISLLPKDFVEAWVHRRKNEKAVVVTRLISFHAHQGQVGCCQKNKNKNSILFVCQVHKATLDRGATSGRPMAPGLIIHFHGGGFVAQSPESHEVCWIF
jgi:acetyl esterase/lipase